MAVKQWPIGVWQIDDSNCAKKETGMMVTESQKELIANAPKLANLWREMAQRDRERLFEHADKMQPDQLREMSKQIDEAEANAASLERTDALMKGLGK